MINTGNRVLKAWFELLDGNLSVPVYRTDAPITETGNYVIIRLEGNSDIPNNHKWISNPVVITDVVTKFSVMVNDSLANEIDEEIGELLFSSPAQHSLPSQADIQIISVQRQNSNTIAEDDGTFKYNRLVTRNIHRVEQI